MMTCGVAWRVGFRFDDASAHPAARKLVHDDFPDEESSQRNRIARQFRSPQATNTILCRRMFHGPHRHPLKFKLACSWGKLTLCPRPQVHY
jgi:hypothetical protein